jgi:hypothetical protein
MDIKPILGVIHGIILVILIAGIPVQNAESSTEKRSSGERATIAPVDSFGDNVYVSWSSNETADSNEEIMFRASTDGGQTFGDKINLSNTTDADSRRAEVEAEGDSVFVTWWETNQTSDTPVMRVSNDNGATFGPILTLAANGTLGEAEEEGGE